MPSGLVQPGTIPGPMQETFRLPHSPTPTQKRLSTGRLPESSKTDTWLGTPEIPRLPRTFFTQFPVVLPLHFRKTGAFREGSGRHHEPELQREAFWWKAGLLVTFKPSRPGSLLRLRGEARPDVVSSSWFATRSAYSSLHS